MNPFEIIQRARKETDSVLISFSAGRDSSVCLDLCSRYFKKIDLVFFYWVEGLELYESFFRTIRKKYPIAAIHQYRHPDIIWYESRLLSQKVKFKFIDGLNNARDKTGIDYIVYGYRASESLQRRARIKQGNGCDTKNKFIYPVAYWTKKHIEHYVKANRVPLLPSYRYGFRDISVLNRETLSFLKSNYNSDYQKLINNIPLLESRLYVK